ncbi:hypothetical protein [Hoylesella saccharolytica]|nr:hypothetical protein [Hoylesella saccharolytica]
MTTKTIFASAAKTVFALAAVVMMSTAFTSCSKDNNDDNGGGGLPAPKAQTVTIDGEEKPILKAEYEDKDNGNYYIFLNLSADGKEKVRFSLNKKLHMNGTPITLSKKESWHDGWYWVVDYFTATGTRLIDTYAYPETGVPEFKTGTLTVKGDPASGTISIKLENGLVTGNDSKDHTLTLSYSGPITEQK